MTGLSGFYQGKQPMWYDPFYHPDYQLPSLEMEEEEKEKDVSFVKELQALQQLISKSEKIARARRANRQVVAQLEEQNKGSLVQESRPVSPKKPYRGGNFPPRIKTPVDPTVKMDYPYKESLPLEQRTQWIFDRMHHWKHADLILKQDPNAILCRQICGREELWRLPIDAKSIESSYCEWITLLPLRGVELDQSGVVYSARRRYFSKNEKEITKGFEADASLYDEDKSILSELVWDDAVWLTQKYPFIHHLRQIYCEKINDVKVVEFEEI